jgi:hypothetical protein
MKVVNPNDTSHTISLIPRYYPFNDVALSLYNEQNKVVSQVDNTYVILNGIMTIDFDFDFTNKEKFEIKITENNNVVYRGKIIATTQESQDYKLTKDLYFYE